MCGTGIQFQGAVSYGFTQIMFFCNTGGCCVFYKVGRYSFVCLVWFFVFHAFLSFHLQAGFCWVQLVRALACLSRIIKDGVQTLLQCLLQKCMLLLSPWLPLIAGRATLSLRPAYSSPMCSPTAHQQHPALLPRAGGQSRGLLGP